MPTDDTNDMPANSVTINGPGDTLDAQSTSSDSDFDATSEDTAPIDAPQLIFDVQCLLLPFLATPDLQRFAMTNRALYAYYEAVKPALWDINQSLRPFFNDPNEFRELQARTGLLISGSHALQFLGRISYGTTDLDLCVEQAHAVVVLDWLESQGYVSLGIIQANDDIDDVFTFPELRAAAMADAYNLRYGQLVFRYSRKDSTRIDIIVSGDSALTSVLDFHSTAVMNFIAADCAISLFPHATFVQRKSMILRNTDPSRTDRVVEKYRVRGFTPVYQPEQSFVFRPGFRWIRDCVFDSGLRLARGAERDDEVRARASWIVPLPLKSEPQQFLDRWPFDPPHWRRLREAPRRLGVEIWYRNGWSLVDFGDGCTIYASDVSYDGVLQYCVPHDFRVFLVDQLTQLFGSLSLDREERYDQWQRKFMSLNF